jgi:hypothetical protein
MKFIVLLILSLLVISQIKSQRNTITLQGRVVDSLTRIPIEGASEEISIQGLKDSIRVITNSKGQFHITLTNEYKLSITTYNLGYKSKIIYSVINRADPYILIELVPEPKEMQAIMIKAPPFSMHGDTIDYKADEYNVSKNALLEELLSKLPGITINDDGSISAFGKTISTIRINGEDFALDDPRLLSQNLPAEIIDRIQLIEEKGGNGRITGFDNGSRSYALNLIVKKNSLNSYLGNISASVGSEDRYSNIGRLMRFRTDQQLLLTFKLNNLINSSLNGEAISAPPDNESNNFQAYFVEKPRTNLRIASRFAFAENRSSIENIQQKSYFLDTFYSNQNNSVIYSKNQKISYYIAAQYGLTRHDSIKIYTEFINSNSTFNTSDSFNFKDQSGLLTSYGNTINKGTSNQNSLNSSLTWIHSFGNKNGILISNFENNLNWANSNSNNFYNNTILSGNTVDTTWLIPLQKSYSSTWEIQSEYELNLSAKSSLDISYNTTNIYTPSNTLVYTIENDHKYLNDSLSNDQTLKSITQQININLKTSINNLIIQGGAGISYLNINSHFTLPDTSYHVNLSSIFPSTILTIDYPINKHNKLNFNYFSSVLPPDVTQLEPIPNYSNPLSIQKGNLSLKPTLNENLTLEYTTIFTSSGCFLHLGSNAVFNKNAIVNNTTTLAGGQQINELENIDGNYSLKSDYTFAKTLKAEKLDASIDGSVSYNHSVSFASGLPNIGNNYSLSQDMSIRYEIKSKLSLLLKGSYTGYHSTYNQSPISQNWINTYDLFQKGRIELNSNCTIKYSLDYKIRTGTPQGISTNPCIISASIEKRYLNDKLSIGIGVNDLLNENSGYTHTLGIGYTEDDRTTYLQRFFLLTVFYKFQQHHNQSSN